MKKNLIRVEDVNLLIDASNAGITRPIDVSDFTEIIAHGPSSLKFVRSNGSPFWLYNLKNSENTLKMIRRAITRGNETISLPSNHVLKEDEYRIKEKLNEALNTAFAVNMDREEFLNAASCLQLTQVDLSFLEDNRLPKRFNNKVGIKVLGIALFELLGVPPYFKAHKERFWKYLLEQAAKRTK
jgi:hypothetical protein